jgi:alpha-tubulin suppressor-like RCC1 family protein
MKTPIIHTLPVRALLTAATFLLPAFVHAQEGAPAVAAGYRHTLFTTADGKLWAMGNNYYGQLGTGDTTNRSTPVQVETSGSVTAVAAGGSDYYGHTLFTTTDGKLWAMGSNSYGQLGTGDTSNRTTPVQVAASGSVTAVAAGYYHTMFTTDVLILSSM